MTRDYEKRTTPKKNKKRSGPFKVHRYGGWLLYFWHGMRFGAWAKLLARGRFRITLNCLPNVLTVTAFTPVNSGLYFASEAIWRRKADALPLDQPPLFVLGHWRTGTTLLHDLFACDSRFAYPTTYECFFPNHFLLTERALSRPLSVFLPKRRPQDAVPVGFSRPQEEEFAFAILGLGTPYNTMAWPRQGPADSDYLDLEGLSAEQREQWERGLLWFYRRLALKHGRPLVLKDPAHTARLKILTRLFPQARYVHIARNPLEVFPSTVKLWRALYSTQGLHNPPHLGPWLDDYVLETFARMAARYEEGRGLVPAGHLVEIRYEDLIRDPKGSLRGIYSALGLPDFAAAEPAVDAYLAARRDHQTSSYELPPDLARRIVEKLGPYIDRFGYRDSVIARLDRAVQ